jgi:predicted nucleic acid-binding protein
MAAGGPALIAETELLVDTSVAIAMLVADHDANDETLRRVEGLRLGLAGHAWSETYSLLTRLPSGSRRTPAEAQSLLEREFPATRFLSAAAQGALRGRLGRLGISGGAVYDALVGEAARSHGLPLMSADARARTTYEKLGVDVRFIGQAGPPHAQERA